MKKAFAWVGAVAFFGVVVGGVLKSDRYPVIVHYHTFDERFERLAPKVGEESFRKQMAYIAKHGYHVVTLDEMVANIKAGKNPPKTLAITFDDGYADNLIGAKILAQYGFPATIFCIVDKMGSDPGYLSPRQAREIERTTPVRIESHTMSHAYLPESKNVHGELIESKNALEKMLGREIHFLAYPIGGFSEQIMAESKAAGYLAAFTTNRGDGKDLYALRRVKMTEKDTSSALWWKLHGYFFMNRHTKKAN